MDRAAAKAELAEIVERLTALEAEREALTNWRNGVEQWLRLPAPSGRTPTQPTLALTEPRKPAGKPVGTLSLRGAAIDILREARGAPLTTSEILTRARARGADSAAQDPENVVDLILYTLKKRRGAPVERIGPRRWRWTGTGETE